MSIVNQQNSSKHAQLLAQQNEAIRAFCQRHHIRKLALFGSFLRDDFRPESDIDVLVEFEAGYTPGLAFINMQDELSRIFDNHEIDLVTEKFLNTRIRDRVMAEAQILYVKG